MKVTAKTALGAMTAALSVVLMLSTAILPFMSYAVPAVTGALLMVMVIECEKKWALFVYAAVSFLSVFIVPDKSAALAYVCFFGYYPILKSILESKLPVVLEKVIKFALFDTIIVAAFAISIRFFTVDTEGVEWLAPHLTRWYIYPILIIGASVFFFMYDVVLTRLVILYKYRWQRKFRKLFKG